jgi:hypothetical protein
MTTVTGSAVDRRLWWLFAAFVAAYGLAGLATLSAQHLWGDDWAQYVLHARNLVGGRPYPDIGYLFNPDFPWAGPRAYAPGTPLVLLPVVALFGIDIAMLKIPGLICMVGALPVIVRLFAPRLGVGAALLAAAIVALYPSYWGLRQHIQSEAPLILSSLCALWWAQRPEIRPDRARMTSLHGAVLGALVFAAIISRALGVALVPAVLVYAWAKRANWPWFLAFGATLALLIGIESAAFAPPPTYEAELRRPSAGRVALQPLGYLNMVAYMFPFPLGLSKVAAALLVAAVVAGAWFARDRLEGRGLRAWAAMVPVYFWYACAYMSALFLASVEPDHRLLTPMLPIGIPLAVHGVRSLVSRLPHSRPVLGSMAIAALVYVVALNFTGRGNPHGQMATCAGCMEMFDFMRSQTPPGAVVVFPKPRAMALLGGRRSWAPAPRYTSGQLERRVRRFGADFIVEGAPGSEFGARYPLPPPVRAWMHGPGATTVFRNREFVVVRPPALGPQAR